MSFIISPKGNFLSATPTYFNPPISNAIPITLSYKYTKLNNHKVKKRLLNNLKREN